MDTKNEFITAVTITPSGTLIGTHITDSCDRAGVVVGHVAPQTAVGAAVELLVAVVKNRVVGSHANHVS